MFFSTMHGNSGKGFRSTTNMIRRYASHNTLQGYAVLHEKIKSIWKKIQEQSVVRIIVVEICKPYSKNILKG